MGVNSQISSRVVKLENDVLSFKGNQSNKTCEKVVDDMIHLLDEVKQLKDIDQVSKELINQSLDTVKLDVISKDYPEIKGKVQEISEKVQEVKDAVGHLKVVRVKSPREKMDELTNVMKEAWQQSYKIVYAVDGLEPKIGENILENLKKINRLLGEGVKVDTRKMNEHDWNKMSGQLGHTRYVFFENPALIEDFKTELEKLKQFLSNIGSGG